MRLDFIDSLKGFAIFLVVFAHVIAWSYTDFSNFQSNIALSGLFKFIYSFHMPLFFFISGYVGLPSLEGNQILQLINKRSIQLLLPYISITLFVTYILKLEMNYWFLITLYLMNIICSFALKTKLKGACIYIWGAIYLITLLFPSIQDIPFLHIFSLKTHLPFFILGIYFARYNSLEAWVSKKCFKYSLVVTVLLFIIRYIYMVECSKIISLLFFYLTAIFAIFFFFFFFKKNYQDNYIYIFLKKIGLQTLSIYLIHVLFKYTIPKLGDYIQMITYPLLMQICYASFISLILIYISITTHYLLSQDSILSTLLLGKRKLQ